MSCNVGEVTERLENEPCCISLTFPSLHLRHSSFSNPRVRKSRYWEEMLLSPIHWCDVTKPLYLLSGELCTSPLHSNCLYVYTVCSRRGGQCFFVLRSRHTDVVGKSSGRSYVTEQGHNVPPFRTRALTLPLLHVRHSSFSSPSFASPTSQALHLIYLASRPWLPLTPKSPQIVLTDPHFFPHNLCS